MSFSLSIFSSIGNHQKRASIFDRYHCNLNEYFLCNNSKCIHRSLLCNGYDNCGDNSDEDRESTCKNFSCKEPDQYDCGMNYCIPKSKLCDSNEDCPNGADELLCKSIN